MYYQLLFYAGSWESVGSGFRVQSNCVTHSNAGQKSGAKFIFITAEKDVTPSFSGYVAFTKNKIAALAFYKMCLLSV